MLITSGSKDERVHDKKDTGVILKGSHRPKRHDLGIKKKNNHTELTHKLNICIYIIYKLVHI